MHLVFIYIGVLFGVFFEGEMIMLSSIIAAHHGYLNFWMVLVIGVVGTFSSDCFYFMLGRKKGQAWMWKYLKIKDKTTRINAMLDKYPIMIFIVYRFTYGLRTIAPTIIGTSKTKAKHFFVFSAVSVLLWVVMYASVGYLFGEFIKSELNYIEHIEKYVIGGLVLLGVLAFVLMRFPETFPKHALIDEGIALLKVE